MSQPISSLFRALSIVLCGSFLAAASIACGPPPAAEPEEPAAPVSAGDAAHGAELFTPCAGCHGQDGEGIDGLGKDLHQNEFLAGMTDAEVVDFLKVGRTAGDPLNTTGVDMPPKGGDPSLSDEDLLDIVAYLRTF